MSSDLETGPAEAASPGSRRAILVATLLVLLSAGCFGANSIFTVVATRIGVPLFAILFWRYGLAAPIVVPIT